MSKQIRKTPPSSSDKGQVKGTEEAQNKQVLSHEFQELADHIREEVLGNNRVVALEHDKVLDKILEEAKPFNIRERLNMEGCDPKEINSKHLKILTIDEVKRIARTLGYCIGYNSGSIFLFNGEYWKEVENTRFVDFLVRIVKKLKFPWSIRKDAYFIKNLMFQFHTLALILDREQDLSTVKVNLKNGTYWISPTEKKLKQFNERDFIKYQLPFEFNPEATAPKWENYLNQVLPEKELQNVLSEYLGYVFIRNDSSVLKFEKVLILFGGGANGKSVAFHVVDAVIGKDNITNYSLQSLTDSTGYYRAKIGNCLLNYATEITGKLDVDNFKKIASGEPIEARLPYGEPFNLRQYGKLIFNCNELPRNVEQTNAFFRRFLIIPFKVTIPEEKQNKRLHLDIIESELDGVFNWILDGLERLISQGGFTPSPLIEEELKRYKTESDSVKCFLEGCGYDLVNKYGGFETLKDLYNEYREYCGEEGSLPVKKLNFRKRLEADGIPVERRGIGNVVLIEKRSAIK